MTHLKIFLRVIPNFWHGQNACDILKIQPVLDAQCVHLPDHPYGVGPSHHHSLHCTHHEIDFYLLCLILTFLVQDMLSQRLKTAILVTVAAQNSPLRGQKVSKL